ncbi:MAG: acetate--CoA ligase [Halovenus sp.]
MGEDGFELETRYPADERVYPPETFVNQANLTDESVYDEFAENWPDVWMQAADLLEWDVSPTTVYDPGSGSWFPDGTLNASRVCVDRHLDDRKNQLALVWEGYRDETRTYTYLDLSREVNEAAAALRELGVEEGDIVTLHMPKIPELPITMLACARIGALHAVVFAGFSADALSERMARSGSEYLVTSDGYYRRGNAVSLLTKTETARAAVDQDIDIVVVDRLGNTERADGTDWFDYEELLARHERERVPPVERAATDDLFVIYTSGTTGEPKRVTQTTGGYLSYVAWTARTVLDIDPTDTYLCTADIGWITGHSYIVYGPLALGTTSVMYEGTPDYPDKDRLWQIVDDYDVTQLYTAPTAIRAFMKWGTEYPDQHDLSSLRLLGTVGEPINPRAWKWYYRHIGNEECPVVDTWWQTETGGMMITTLPGIGEMKPGSVGPPLPGISVSVVDSDGEPVERGTGGYLVVDRPWPGMPQELSAGVRWAKQDDVTYLDGFDWAYATGDGALVDEDGYITILGRVDDVLKVSGYRLGTLELESAILGVTGAAEAAVVGGECDDGTRGLFAYVRPADGQPPTEKLQEAILDTVNTEVGEFARPDRIIFTPELPKTRSGKIMRRLLVDIVNDDEIEDTSVLRNPEIINEIKSTLRSG